jgi:single-strand DNA-binding protein
VASLNKCMFIGNVGRDPEIRSTQGGKEIANLSLACSETWKDKATGEKKERTEWVRVSIFNEGLVRLVKSYVKKGSKLYIEGQMQTRKWTNKDGVEVYTTEIVLQSFNGQIVMLDGKQSPASSGNELIDEITSTFPGATLSEDEIPF